MENPEGNSATKNEVNFDASAQEQKHDDRDNTDKVNNDMEHYKTDVLEEKILDEIQNSPAIFQSQQIGDPELTTSDKRNIAKKLLCDKPVSFLLKFGEFLKEEHLNYFISKFSTSYEVQYYVKNLKCLLSDHNRKIILRNRRYEAMKRMEAEGSYFSEVEMEKREPLLYHQMVGQYLSEKEKLIKSRQAQKDVIPSFSNFLIYKLERDEINDLVKSQQEEEDKMEKIGTTSEEDETSQSKLWGEDWEEKKPKRKFTRKKLKEQNNIISKKEKNLLLQEFQSIMKNNFLNGKDADFNYSEVDLNPDFDCVDLRAQDEEEKYFDEETNDSTICTDTGIEDY